MSSSCRIRTPILRLELRILLVLCAVECAVCQSTDGEPSPSPLPQWPPFPGPVAQQGTFDVTPAGDQVLSTASPSDVTQPTPVVTSVLLPPPGDATFMHVVPDVSPEEDSAVSTQTTRSSEVPGQGGSTPGSIQTSPTGTSGSSVPLQGVSTTTVHSLPTGTSDKSVPLGGGSSTPTNRRPLLTETLMETVLLPEFSVTVGQPVFTEIVVKPAPPEDSSNTLPPFSPSVFRETVQEVATTLPPLRELTQPTPFIFMDPFTPFNYWQVEDMNFEEQVVWYHKRRCGDVCVHIDMRYRDCALCHCDRACLDFGDCCPQSQFQKPEEAAIPPPCPPLLHATDSFYMVTSCLPEVHLTESRRKCETPTLDWREQLPVSDLSTQVTYRNKYCAICNNVTSFTAWSLSLDCTKNDTEKIVHASSAEELYWLAVQGVACPLKFQSPSGVATRSCTPVPEPLISSCNVTGLWPIYDERIVRACAAFTSPISHYRNVFCRLCNTAVQWRNDQAEGNMVVGRVSLTAILNLQEDGQFSMRSLPASPGSTPALQCSPQSFLDPHTSQCRALHCHEGKRLRDSQCHSVLSTTNFLRYTVGADVTLVTSLSRVKELRIFLRDVAETLQTTLRQQLHFTVTLMQLLVRSITCSDAARLVAHAYIELLPRQSFAIDSTEESLLALFNSTALNDTTGSATSVWKLARQTPAFSAEHDVTSCQMYNFTLDDYPNGVYAEDGIFHEWGALYDKVVVNELSPLLVCRQVTLEAGEFLHDPAEKTLTVVATNESVLYPGYSLDNHTASVCLDVYLAGFSRQQPVDEVLVVENTTSPNQGNTVAGLLSLSCTAVSLTLLAATFVTYLAFKGLRTTAGVCTMCMIAVLFLAQAVFEFGAEQTEIAGLCVALGVLAHYLWLSATFWMNACTSLMFYKLVFPLQARVHLMSGRKVLSVSFLYTCLCPGVIVSSSLAVNHFLYGDLGYGGAVCYVKRTATRRLAVALPIGCLVLLNLGLFGATLLRLRRGSGVSCSRESRIGLWGCAKLSVITGLSWMFLFLYEAFPYPAMEYVAILLFGLYGLVVFVAFVVNQQVFSLLRERFAKKESSNSKSGSLRPLESSSTSDTGTSSLREKHVAVTKM